MKRRSFCFLSLVFPFITSLMQQLPMVTHEVVDDYEEYLHYWCPTAKMVEDARVQRIQAEKVYRVVTELDFDI